MVYPNICFTFNSNVKHKQNVFVHKNFVEGNQKEY